MSKPVKDMDAYTRPVWAKPWFKTSMQMLEDTYDSKQRFHAIYTCDGEIVFTCPLYARYPHADDIPWTPFDPFPEAKFAGVFDSETIKTLSKIKVTP